LKPKLLILDEATSALDVSIQAQVLNLLIDLQHKLGLAYIFITQNMGVVRYMVAHVAVMYLGKVIEYGTADQILLAPHHPYTQNQIASVPQVIDRADIPRPLNGDVPSPINPPSGCTFHPRCPVKQIKEKEGRDTLPCQREIPPLRESPLDQNLTRCHFS
jgi:peptide/nickel transport system ATP-binding protein